MRDYDLFGNIPLSLAFLEIQRWVKVQKKTKTNHINYILYNILGKYLLKKLIPWNSNFLIPTSLKLNGENLWNLMVETFET